MEMSLEPQADQVVDKAKPTWTLPLMPNEVIVISDSDDESIVEQPPPSERLGSRKRYADSEPSEASTQAKRPRLDERPSPSISSSRPGNALNHPRGATFELPEDPEDHSEELVLRLLNGDEELYQDKSPHRLLFRLSNFIFFYDDKRSNMEGSGRARVMIGLDQLESSDKVNDKIGGYGAVASASIEPEEEAAADAEDDEEGMPAALPDWRKIVLGPVLKWWIGDGVGDREMYILTSAAWYVLEEPADEYRRVYERFWKSHKLSQLIMSFATKNPTGDKAEFTESLESDFTIREESFSRIGRAMTGNDLDLAISGRFIENDHLYLPKSLAQTLAESVLGQRLKRMQPRGDPRPYTCRSQQPPPGVDARTTRRTVVSPLVSKIAARYFRNPFEVVGPPPEHMNPPREPIVERFPDAPLDVGEWVHKDIDSYKNIQYFSRLSLEGRSYKLGDCVAIKQGEIVSTRDYRPPATSSNQLADNSWFGIIKRLYTAEDPEAIGINAIRFAHVQWFVHGCWTDLGELAASNELFLTYDCSNIGLATIQKLISVKFIKGESRKVIPEIKEMEDRFFCRFRFERADGSFHDFSQPDFFLGADIDLQKRFPEPVHCDACMATLFVDREEAHKFFEVKATPSKGIAGLNYANVTYHKYDTILYKPLVGDREPFGQDAQTEQVRLRVGIIKSWAVAKRVDRSSYLTVRNLGFIDDLIRQRADATHLTPPYLRTPMDERRLYLVGDEIDIPVENIFRRCVVRYDPHWDRHSQLESEPNEFFLTHRSTKLMNPTVRDLHPINPRDFPVCEECSERQGKMDSYFNFYKPSLGEGANASTGTQMNTLDLFSGAGGLALGVTMTGALAVKWAVEKSIPASQTFRRNFPDAQVYTQDINECASNALRHGQARHRVPSLDPQNPRKRHMPPPQAVDVILAGLPCSGFSMQSVYGRDTKEAQVGLVLVVLSLIDFYRPRFFIIENVARMINYESLDYSTEETISFAIVKIILRTLTALGYSVRWGLFNAVNYGSPQHRSRLFFYGSRGGSRLPEIPIPTHVASKNSRTRFQRFTLVPTKLMHYLAALPPVNISSAIGDLPPFDWTVRNPLSGVTQRANVPSFIGESPAGSSTAGYPHGCDYQQERPKTLYQARMRRGMHVGEKVTLHYTRTFKEHSHKAEKVIAVAMRPNADHRTIPRVLYDWAYSHPLSAAARDLWAPGRYGRLDWQGVFNSFVTRIDPTSKQGKVLHPSQRRVLTIREVARGQGFPDHYQFCGDPGAIIRQIGEAVPVQMGEALGRMLRNAMIAQKLWESYQYVWYNTF